MALRGAATVMPEAAEASAAAAIATPIQLRAEPVVERRERRGTALLGDVPARGAAPPADDACRPTTRESSLKSTASRI